MEVRDPIHGSIVLDGSETAIADHRWVQRLRGVRQTGFSDLPFPGATHTRYAHSLGVMHLAGRAFDSAYRHWAFDHPDARDRLRRVLRLAALCHDLGHGPFSHCMEYAMPPLPELGITWAGSKGAADRRATHEDYTLAILEHTTLGDAIATHFGFTARHVAALLSPDVRPPDDLFRDGGLDHRRLLSQIVSSELDVDRLDYLVRDATYTGARYGQIDDQWLLSNLAVWPADGQLSLAIDGRAVYAFDHFLIARHHMFLMVYFHHRSVAYEEHLRRYLDDPACTWAVPADLDAYLEVDDVALLADLRRSRHPEARRIVEHRAFKRVLERHGNAVEVDTSPEKERLAAAGFDVFQVASRGQLSRYQRVGRKRRAAPSIYVLGTDPGAGGSRVGPLEEVSRVFVRYAEELRIDRLYVAPEEAERARALLK